MTLPFDKIYCLHLAENKERYENIIKQFERLGIKDQVEIWWTCKREISNTIGQMIPTLKVDYYGDIDSLKPEKKIMGGVFNCALEHYTIIKQAYLRGFNNILIMEDDIKFIDDIEKIEYMFNSVPNDYDLVKFWTTGMNKERITNNEPYKKLSSKSGKAAMFSNMCYAISRNGMKRYIELTDENFTPADSQFFNFDYDKYNVYKSNSIFVKPDNTLISDIMNMSQDDADKILWEAFTIKKTKEIEEKIKRKKSQHQAS